ncbi:MAG: CHAT domain-containing protein [Leptolyngbyaceae cyanobacterium bins.59]|nr:CHAT domain-containing protein [Leptolyngbyaceae cyanobacterium bins.59]
MPLRRRSRWVILLLSFALSLILSLHPWLSRVHASPDSLLQQSRQRYEAGQLEEAKTLLQQVRQQSQGSGNALIQAIVLSNLALIEGEQGNWEAANQTIAEAVQGLQSNARTPDQTVLAQVLNVQGRLQLAQGEAQAALQTWQQTAKLYQQAGNPDGQLQSQLRQAEALQRLGLHNQAFREVLDPLQKSLQQQPNSLSKSWGLRSVSAAVGVTGSLNEALKIGQESLTVAEQLNVPTEVAASQLNLANLLLAKTRDTRSLKVLRRREREQLEKDVNEALRLYEAVAATPSLNRIRAQLNQLTLLVESDRLPAATQLANSLQPQILALPPDRQSIEVRLNFANTLLRLRKASGQGDAQAVIQLLQQTVAQAEKLGDRRLLANTLGNLARAQEESQQLGLARATTERAILVATAANANEQTYRWTAQLGRLQEREGNRPGAIESYSQAVNLLKTLRRDLLGVTAENQLVDQGTLDPVHRQLVNLLLPEDGSQANVEVLGKTRDVIESLQLEEINNYLKAACIQSQAAIDQIQVPNKTAIIYPIVLPGRVATIMSVTGKDPQDRQEPQLYNAPVPQATVEEMVQAFQDGLRNRISLEFQQPSEQLYNWLIKPIEARLQEQKVETLVFVLDGVLRSVPMAALSDGKQFLIEKYSIATTPGLRLSNPQPLQTKVLSSVAFGLTEAATVTRDGIPQPFPPLPYVEQELKDLQQEINPSIVKLNRDFTPEQFKTVLQKLQPPIVHLATHGQFSSNRDQTFLVALNGETIDIDLLSESLGASDPNRANPIELLVLSACETAKGDDRAPLGLAGIALKSGARSTIASLWKVNDFATSQLMQEFYKELATRKVTKAVALQRAQQAILKDPNFRRLPFFWAPFILVGNWL